MTKRAAPLQTPSVGQSPAAGALVLRCLETGQPVYTGIHFTAENFAGMGRGTVRVQCPICGEPHRFRFSDAWLTQVH